MNELLLRRRQMVVGGEVDIYTYLRRQGCIAWFPLAYEGDFTDVIGGITLTGIVASRMVWDSIKGMYDIGCMKSSVAASIDIAASRFYTEGDTYGLMANVELISGYCDVATVVWNSAAAGNGALSVSEDTIWSANFVRFVKTYNRYRYVNDKEMEPARASFNRAFANIGLGRNRAYANSGHVYVRDLLFFNKLIPFATYQTIKAKLEELRNN